MPFADLHTQWPGDRTDPADPALLQFLASGGPFAGDATVRQRMEQERLVELLDKIGPAFVLSNSLGGPSGFLVADARPELVVGLVQLEPIGPAFAQTFGPDTLQWGVAAVPMAYDPPADFVMVHGIFKVPQLIVTHAGTPYRTLQDLVEAAKKEPRRLNVGYPGIGAAQHLTGELFRYRAGIDITPVLYKGSGTAMTDLLGGQVPLLVDSLVSALPHVKSGKIRALAVTTLQRTPHLPELPTVAEQGYAGFEGVGWGGLIVPKATPREIVERIAADMRRVMLDPAVQQRIVDRGLIPDPRGAKEWGEFVADETLKWGEIVRRIGLRMD